MNYLTIITILTESVNDNYLRLNRFNEFLYDFFEKRAIFYRMIAIGLATK